MTQNFTNEDLVAHLYGEATLTQRLKTQEALRRDPVLVQELEELRVAKSQFPRVKFKAPKASRQFILNYSRSTALEEQV